MKMCYCDLWQQFDILELVVSYQPAEPYANGLNKDAVSQANRNTNIIWLLNIFKQIR